MAEEVNIRTEEPRPHYYGYEPFKRVSWPAIFGGTFVALGVTLLFATFGLWIGFASWNPQTGGGPVVWSVIWYLITAFFALFFGAWATTKLSGNPDKGIATLHGLVTWGLTTATVFVLMGSALGGLFASVLQSPLTQTAAQAAIPPGGAAVPSAQAAAPQLANVAGVMSRFWVTLFFGTLAGLIGAVVGAMVGRPKREVVAGEAAPEWRRAA